MEIEAQRTWCSLLLLATILFVGYQVLFIVTTVAISSFRFFWAWDQIFRMTRPAPLLQSAVCRFVYNQASSKNKESPSSSLGNDDTCPICLAEYGKSVGAEVSHDPDVFLEMTNFLTRQSLYHSFIHSFIHIRRRW